MTRENDNTCSTLFNYVEEEENKKNLFNKRENAQISF